MEILEKILGVKDKIENLRKENDSLKQQLKEKQEHINKTNFYWKKKFYSKKS